MDIVILLLISFISIIGFTSSAYAQVSRNIDATVKISVCGNDEIEGGEGCEGVNLNNKTCSSLGYSGGILSCDIACTYDTYACIIPSPTPTFTPTPTPTTAPSQTNTSITVTQQPTNTVTPTVTITFGRNLEFFTNLVTNSKKEMPAALDFFDIRNVGKLLIADVSKVVRLWVDEWRMANKTENNRLKSITQNYKCDINLDKECNLKDFSILMYYFED